LKGTGIRTLGPPIRETVVDTTTRLTAPAYFACAALSLEHFMLRKIGASLSAISADIDNGSEWWSSEQEEYFSIENTGAMTSSSVSNDEEDRADGFGG
jgi:hypothetical protein